MKDKKEPHSLVISYVNVFSPEKQKSIFLILLCSKLIKTRFCGSMECNQKVPWKLPLTRHAPLFFENVLLHSGSSCSKQNTKGTITKFKLSDCYAIKWTS